MERTQTAAEKDTQWRSNMRPDAPAPVARSPALSNRDSSTPSSPLAAPATLPTPAAPATRQKLNLAKRTVSEAPSEAQASQTSDAKASPFGAAKPIDTAAKEKEIEEKRLAALKEKKEAEEKANEEKRIADQKAKEEERLAKESEKAANAEKPALSPKEKPNGVEAQKENGVTGPPPGKNYEILRRQANDDADAADEEPEGTANGVITDDKAIKPKEIVRDIPQANGNTSSSGNTPVEPTAEALEEEGWSTVQKPQKPQKPRKNQRNGNVAARAVAS